MVSALPSMQQSELDQLMGLGDLEEVGSRSKKSSNKSEMRDIEAILASNNKSMPSEHKNSEGEFVTRGGPRNTQSSRPKSSKSSKKVSVKLSSEHATR